MQALFFRDYRKFHGGVLKVWDYFNHARAAPGWDAWIQFGPRSNWDESNPWLAVPERALRDASHIVPDLFFVAGRDWLQLDKHPAADRNIPVVNLVQHVRHADEASARFGFLERPAIRVCVSDEVAEALRATGLVNGPILTIPNGLDLAALAPLARTERTTDLFIVGIKQPALAAALAERLARPGRRLEMLGEPVPRQEFLARLGSARVALFLPNETEGFYLPALEGMALGALVVCPDCVGNRGYLTDGVTGFRPAFALDAVVGAAERALALDPAGRDSLVTAAGAVASRHGMGEERGAFHALLAGLGSLWGEAAAAGPGVTRA